MSEPPQDSVHSPSFADPAERNTPQYSLQGLLIAITVFSLGLGVCYALPDPLAGLIIVALSLLVPVGLLAWAVYGSGSSKTFCIGALIATGPHVLTWGTQLISDLQFVSGSGAMGPGNLGPGSRIYRPTPKELLDAFSTIGLAWRPGVVTMWVVGVFAGLIFVIARAIARQRAAAMRGPSDSSTVLRSADD